MKNTNYVTTTLAQFLNENRNITLTRKYGKKEPVVVNAKAPIRNQVLQYVAENVKVTKNSLKRFISNLNENDSSTPSVSMWIKRNEKYFVTETKNNVTTYKLSNLGKKLITTLNEGCNCGTSIIRKPSNTRPKNQKRINENFNELEAIIEPYDRDNLTSEEFVDFCETLVNLDDSKLAADALKQLADRHPEMNKEFGDYDPNLTKYKEGIDILLNKYENNWVSLHENDEDYSEEEWKDPKQKTHDFEDHGEEGIYDEMCENSFEEAKKIVESIKAKRMFEAEEVEDEEVEDEEVEDEEVEDEEVEDETEEVEDEEVEDEEVEDEEDEDVEITEFILSVDDPEAAIAELAELGITAEKVEAGVEDEAEEVEDETEEVEDEAEEVEDEAEEVEDEAEEVEDETEDETEDDFDLGSLDSFGDIDGEEEKTEESTVNEEAEDETEDDFGSVEDETEDDFGSIDDEIEDAEETEDDFGSMDDETGDIQDEVTSDNQIKVSAENWPILKGWLESKGVDTKELFGGEIIEADDDEVEELDEPIEDEINFDELEDLEKFDDESEDEDESKEDKDE